MTVRILVVEDEGIIAEDLVATLREFGYHALSAGTVDRVFEALTSFRPTLVVMDIQLGGSLDGVALAGLLRTDHRLPVVFLSAHTDAKTVGRAMQADPYGYLTKPVRSEELRLAIGIAMARHEAEMNASHQALPSRTSEAHLEMLSLSSPDEWAIVDRDGNVVRSTDPMTLGPAGEVLPSAMREGWSAVRRRMTETKGGSSSEPLRAVEAFPGATIFYRGEDAVGAVLRSPRSG